MSDSHVCPFCQYENSFGTDHCDGCGQMLNSDTTISKTGSELSEIQRPALRAAEFVMDVLYLYVAGASTQRPIQHQGKDEAILGRSSSKMLTAPGALIDLHEYHALTLGVSRQHARISHDDVTYTIEDLDSANGTWLNGNRLLAHQPHPLRSGDHVQLGELLMFIYYV